MNVTLNIPREMVAYSRFVGIEPRELAQFTLDEVARDIASEWLSEPDRNEVSFSERDFGFELS